VYSARYVASRAGRVFIGTRPCIRSAEAGSGASRIAIGTRVSRAALRGSFEAPRGSAGARPPRRNEARSQATNRGPQRAMLARWRGSNRSRLNQKRPRRPVWNSIPRAVCDRSACNAPLFSPISKPLRRSRGNPTIYCLSLRRRVRDGSGVAAFTCDGSRWSPAAVYRLATADARTCAWHLQAACRAVVRLLLLPAL
jgi:hypothetical protein